MNMKSHKNFELEIWKALASRQMSISHDRWHIDQVRAFVDQLHKLHGGDPEVLKMAAIMHDLGRADKDRPHGKLSRQVSVEIAGRLLEELDFPPEKREAVLDAIREHDEYDHTPSTLEGRILKDADFLAGFGAWGILRIALWTAETEGNISTFLKRATVKMPKRLANMEFVESFAHGNRQMPFVDLFLEELKRETILPPTRKGQYIVLEGVSGAGKNTQVDILAERLTAENYDVVVVNEPGDNYRAMRNAWQSQTGGILMQDQQLTKYLMMADRYQTIQEKVLPALESGKIVVSNRSFVSTLIYQCETDYDVAKTTFDHYDFVPYPNIVFLFDLDAETAFARASNRNKPRGWHEKPDLLKTHRSKYQMVCEKLFPNHLCVVNAEKTIDEIADFVWSQTQTRVLAEYM